MCLYPCLSYPACKSHLFGAAFYCQALPYFPTFPHEQHGFMKKKNAENIMRVLIVCIILWEKFLILTRIN
jgi:hypothetical protein